MENMKLPHLFAVLSMIALVVISEGAIIVHAQTLTKDFGEEDLVNAYGDKYCSFDVTATIETEPNGNWIVNKTYEVVWVITITYLNQSIYNSNYFSLNFYNPENPIYNTLVQKAVIYETTVTPQNSGNLW